MLSHMVVKLVIEKVGGSVRLRVVLSHMVVKRSRRDCRPLPRFAENVAIRYTVKWSHWYMSDTLSLGAYDKTTKLKIRQAYC